MVLLHGDGRSFINSGDVVGISNRGNLNVKDLTIVRSGVVGDV
jgi:hypothetical protein